uniref:Uncharacterized protein n=1 Tax=Sinocyclocheilus rhinocerous TaxID=307959 RepID=A0A673LJI3_9TELE
VTKSPNLIGSIDACESVALMACKRRTRVNIGAAFQQWRELKEREGLELDAEVALFLLDRRVMLILLCFTQLICVGF